MSRIWHAVGLGLLALAGARQAMAQAGTPGKDDLLRGIRVGMPFAEAVRILKAVHDADEAYQFVPYEADVEPGRRITTGAVLRLRRMNADYRGDDMGVEAIPGPKDTLITAVARKVVYQAKMPRSRDGIRAAFSATIGAEGTAGGDGNVWEERTWMFDPAGKPSPKACPVATLSSIPDTQSRVVGFIGGPGGDLGATRVGWSRVCGFIGRGMMVGPDKNLVNEYYLYVADDATAVARGRVVRLGLQKSADSAAAAAAAAAANRKPE